MSPPASSLTAGADVQLRNGTSSIDRRAAQIAKKEIGGSRWSSSAARFRGAHTVQLYSHAINQEPLIVRGSTSARRLRDGAFGRVQFRKLRTTS